MQRMPLDRLTTNTKNHVTTASTARMGAKRIFKRKRISISLQFRLFLLSAYRKLPCPARMPDRKKSRGGLLRSKPPRMGYIPLYLMEASRDRIPLAACQIRS